MLGAIWNAIGIIVGYMILIPLLIFVVVFVGALLDELVKMIWVSTKEAIDRFKQNN